MINASLFPCPVHPEVAGSDRASAVANLETEWWENDSPAWHTIARSAVSADTQFTAPLDSHSNLAGMDVDQLTVVSATTT